MKEIILPITCFQIKLGLFITLAITAPLSLIIGFNINNGGLILYGGVGTSLLFAISLAFLLIAWAEGRFPRFPIRCKCND